MSHFEAYFWPLATLTLHIAVGLPTAAHAVLGKRDVRAAIGWVGLIWLTPLLGSMLYWVFGVNRIRRRAVSLRADLSQPDQPHAARETSPEAVSTVRAAGHDHLLTLVELVGRVTNRPLLEGNLIEPLLHGDAAYPAMIAAIDAAQTSIAMCSYIFDHDDAGEMFAAALSRAAARGVKVRVLVDAVGARYSRPTILRRLSAGGVPNAVFMPTFTRGLMRYGNLRTHRKILVVDGRVGFTGGMNVRAGNLLQSNTGHPVQDLHFRLEGPVVAQLQEVLLIDWSFAADELLEGPQWFPPLSPAGGAAARGVPDGPDDDFDHMRLVFLGALACAKDSVKIVTPYFLPEPPLIDAINVAAMRGVTVDVVLPQVNNLFFVQWAANATLWQVLERGCRVWLVPPPFDHTKLMLVDGVWCCFGSSNWDPRSLRLNFEFNVECYDRELTGRLEAVVDQKMAKACRLTLAELDARPFRDKLRDGVARLFLPYL